MKTKICSKCKVRKDRTLFFTDKRKVDGLMSCCKKCHRITCENWAIQYGGSKEYAKKYNKKIKGTKISFARVYSKKKYNAKQSGINFNILKKDFIEWYSKVEQECAYCGLKQSEIIKYKKLLPNTNVFYLSLDRVDNSKGYSLDNVCLACTRCNLIKSNFFSSEEMKEIGQKYVKPKWN